MAATPDALARLRAARGRRPRAAAFAGVFAATLLGFIAVGAVLPILPRYVRGPVGSSDLAVGIVMGAFAFTAVVGRPVGGRRADARGRRVVVVAGLLITAAAGLLYLVPAGVAGLVVARLVLGVGDGWVFTAGLSWIVDLAPEERRGQAIGLFGLAVWSGLTIGPLVGEAVFALASYEAVFVAAALFPLAGAAVARRVPDRHPGQAVGRGPRSLLPRAIVAPGVALALANIGYGTMSGFIVLHLVDEGVSGSAFVFTAFAAAVILARLVLGRLPDRLGPRTTAACAAFAEATGLAIIAMSSDLVPALAGAVTMGIGFSLLFPSLALIVVSRVGDEQRGTALGAFSAFFDVGVGIGAPLAGAVSALAGYPAAFWTAAGAAAAGMVVGLATSRHGAPGGPPAAAQAPTPG